MTPCGMLYHGNPRYWLALVDLPLLSYTFVSSCLCLAPLFASGHVPWNPKVAQSGKDGFGSLDSSDFFAFLHDLEVPLFHHSVTFWGDSTFQAVKLGLGWVGTGCDKPEIMHGKLRLVFVGQGSWAEEAQIIDTQMPWWLGYSWGIIHNVVVASSHTNNRRQMHTAYPGLTPITVQCFSAFHPEEAQIINTQMPWWLR